MHPGWTLATCLERGISQLVGPNRAYQRMVPDAIDRSGAAHDNACLRTAKQFVAAERDDIGAGSQTRAHGGFVGQRRRVGVIQAEPATAEVLDKKKTKPQMAPPPQ